MSGQGIASLREHGITVDVGVEAEAATRLLAPYLVHRVLGRSFVVLKTATSLDGRIAARDGSSRWITGPAARADVHELRADSQAVIVGAGTALADRPSLTARDTREPVERQPLRVVLDAHGRVPADGPLFDAALAPTLVVTTAAAPDEATSAWLAAGAKVQTVPPAANGTGVDLLATLELLAGSACSRRWSRAAQSSRARCSTPGSSTVSSPTSRRRSSAATVVPSFGIAGPATIADAPRLQLVDVTRLGDDVRLDYQSPPPWLNGEVT